MNIMLKEKEVHDLLIIDVQIHYLKDNTKEYIKKLINLLENESYTRIHLVIDKMHEETGYDFDWNEIEQFTNYSENEELFNELYFELYENNRDLADVFYTYIYEYRLPIELSTFLILNLDKIDIIEKTYGDLRDIIDNDIETLPYYLKIIEELHNNNFNYQIMDIEDYNNAIKNNLVLKKLFEVFEDDVGIEFNEICERLRDVIRVDFEYELEKYKNIIDNSNNIYALGGGAMECFYEEISIIHTLTNNIDVNIIDNLVYGEKNNFYSELENFKNKIKYLNELNTQELEFSL